jgi:hypothetical protein
MLAFGRAAGGLATALGRRVGSGSSTGLNAGACSGPEVVLVEVGRV